MLCDVESGNITLLLSLITNAEESSIEKLLMNGVMPGEVAKFYGKYDEYKAFLKSNIAAQLQVLIENHELSNKEATDLFDRINEC